MVTISISTTAPPTIDWSRATDAHEVHELLLACDAFNATPSAPAPRRNFTTTERSVALGNVYVARRAAHLVASFTLSDEPPFIADLSVFPAAERPLYLRRLTVSPDVLEQGSIVGAQCLRKATEVAIALGADAIRAEANPDLVKVFTLLTLFGFREYARSSPTDANRRAYLQKFLGCSSA